MGATRWRRIRRSITRESGRTPASTCSPGSPSPSAGSQLAGVSTAVLEGGDGPPVVLLHGPAGNAAHWLRVIPDLAATRRVIVPDLPGHGASIVDGAGELDAERVVAWLGELIERTCPAPPVLVGYALGGAIAPASRPRHGDRLGGLVLVDSLGLAAVRARAGVRRRARALPRPTRARRRTTACGASARSTSTALRDAMGERWEPFEAYNVDSARTPSAMGALGSLMAQFAAAGDRRRRRGSPSRPR